MAKKNRADASAPTTRAAITQRVISGVAIPERLAVDDGLQEFLKAILDVRDYSSWNASDLSKAVNLAACQRDITRIRLEIEEEGDIIHNERGTPVVNPRHTLLEVLSRRELALSRALHVHAEATVGRSREQAGRSKAQRQALSAIDEAKNRAAGLIGGL